MRLRWVFASVSLFLMFFAAMPAAAQTPSLGPVTRLPLPRFASLKSDRINLREGPSRDHRTRFVYRRPGLPVEIIAEFETWRRIRDHEGTEGWVLHSLLSGKRTALVARDKSAPWQALRQRPETDAPVLARLEPGVLGQIRVCNTHWCRFEVESFDGWVRQDKLWGVYPPEKIKD
jgi:SH3-like domain-containing protein